MAQLPDDTTAFDAVFDAHYERLCVFAAHIVGSDAARHVLTLPLRLKNTGASRWYGPLTLRLDVNPTLGGAGGAGAFDVRFYPTILGATNRKTGPGAEFDLTPLAGTAGIVEPGATTGALMLQLKVDDPADNLGKMTVFVSAGAQ